MITFFTVENSANRWQNVADNYRLSGQADILKKSRHAGKITLTQQWSFFSLYSRFFITKLIAQSTGSLFSYITS